MCNLLLARVSDMKYCRVELFNTGSYTPVSKYVRALAFAGRELKIDNFRFQKILVIISQPGDTNIMKT